MRVTSSMYYKSLYGTNNTKLSKELFDVNRQISSGLQIQYASDNVISFTETMRLDNEIVTLGQVKKSTDSGYKVSNQTDIALNEFNTSITRMKTLLISAANDTHDETSRDAVSSELRVIESHLRSLANTSINGKYLFSGSATSTKPISLDGKYNGNNEPLKAFLGSDNQQQYNLTGAELFLGEEPSRRREITTNKANSNLIDDTSLNSSSSIRDLMGDNDDDDDPNTAFFYLRGRKSDGTAIKEKIELQDTLTIDNLLTEIGKAYGNTNNSKIVNVTLNNFGEIVVEDKRKGSSKLDFHMVGAIDYKGNTADVDDVDDLDSGDSNYPPSGDLYVKEFIQSGLESATGAASNIEGIVYDRTLFTKDGSKITSNVAQIEKDGNAFASPATKISEVADLSQGTAGTLDGTTFVLDGKDINGDSYSVKIELKTAGSTFKIGSDSYDIYDMQTPRSAVPADEMTYQQLLDVMNMVVTDSLPSDSSVEEYDKAIENASLKGEMGLTYDGKISFLDATSYDTKATISLYDENSDDFTKDASVMTFNTNNALTISDPKTDFFATIDDIIKSVEEYKTYPDATSGEKRTVGIENAIGLLDDLHDHLLKSHSLVGAQSNALTLSLERTEVLEVSTMSLRSSVVDTDLAEASLELAQLTNNYEAMLSIVGKVSKLSLVNYL